MKKIIFSLFFSILCLGTLGALDIKDGRIKISVDERNGRFTLFYLSDVTKNVYIPLLYDQESRTTYPTLLLDQKTYKLGEANEFRTSVSNSGIGATIEYRSSFCIVQQRLSFVKSQGAALSDGISIDFTVENTSEKDIIVGVRFLFDTWMGERLNKHFEAKNGSPILAESEFTKANSPGWLISTGEKGVNLLIDLNSATTVPDKTVCANWKRINDSPWSFDVVSSRNFTLLPYSINDSALALYYEPKTIRRGASLAMKIVMGESGGGGFQASSEAASSTDLQNSSTTENAFNSIVNSSTNGKVDLMTDLIAARDLIAGINALIGSAKTPTEQQLKVLREIIEKLEQRKRSY